MWAGDNFFTLIIGAGILLIESPATTFDGIFNWKLTSQGNNPVFNTPNTHGYIFLILFYILLCAIVGAIAGFTYGKFKS